MFTPRSWNKNYGRRVFESLTRPPVDPTATSPLKRGQLAEDKASVTVTMGPRRCFFWDGPWVILTKYRQDGTRPKAMWLGVVHKNGRNWCCISWLHITAQGCATVSSEGETTLHPSIAKTSLSESALLQWCCMWMNVNEGNDIMWV